MAGTTATLAIFALLAGCGGQADLTCDEPSRYEDATQHDRLKSPEDLDELDALREMPLPQANPAPARPAGSPCLDLPPRVGPSN
jgi:uncharacterized lipoprotein